jgi:hypothetical protein
MSGLHGAQLQLYLSRSGPRKIDYPAGGERNSKDGVVLAALIPIVPNNGVPIRGCVEPRRSSCTSSATRSGCRRQLPLTQEHLPPC